MSEGNGLPKGWGAVSLADLTSHRPICYGVLKPGPRQTNGVPLIRITDISADVVDESDIYLITDRLSKEFSRSILRGGEILLSIQGTIGRTAICPQSLAGANVSRTLAVIDPDERVDRRFLRFWCLSRNGRFPVCGSTRASLNIGAIRDLLVPIAPLPEQHRIVEKIEELFSDLDAGVASLERAKANLKRYRASVLKSAVEGRLTEEWRKEHPQAEDGEMLLDRILRERREKWEKDQLQKFKEKGKEPPKNWESKYEEPSHEVGLYDLPSSWVWASALEICERVENGNTPPSDEMTSGSGEVPFIKVYNLTRDGRLDFTVNPTFVSQETHEQRLGRSRVLPNDVLMNIVGPPLGKVSLVPDTYPEWNMNQAIVLFRTSGVVLSRYLAICVMSDDVLRWITRTAKATAGQFNLSVGNSRLLPLPLPPLAEQEQIVALVEERLSQIDSAEKTIDAELIRSKRLRQSILKRAFEGKLVPQDPKDEPASVLLERIKRSREAEQPKKNAKKARAK